MIIRDDIKGEPAIPVELTKFLRRVGGVNPNGENNYRLAHTSNRMHLQGGAWKEWAEGLSVAERGGMVMHENLGIMLPSDKRPERIVVEMRWSKKYCSGFEGWLVERWMPASFFGAQGVWEHLHLPGHADILLLGPYPADGDYECCSDIVPELPTKTKLQECVNYQTYVQETQLHTDVKQAVLDRVYNAAKQYEEQMEKNAAATEARIKDFLSPMTSTSLEAGRIRTKWAERAGVKEHAGA